MDIYSALLLVVLAVGLGLAIGYWIYGRALESARHEIERLTYRLQAEEQLHEERMLMLDDAQDRMNNAFAALSQRALRENNEQFIQLAQANLGRFQAESKADLEQRQQSIEYLVDPIRQALEKTEQHLYAMERAREVSFSILGEQLRALSIDQVTLRQETTKLASALKNPTARGQWGELSLKRIVELAGMTEHCDFALQVQRSNDERTIRPDMVVRLPDARELIVDAKAPMDAYLEAMDAGDELTRVNYLQKHARSLREHVKILAAKRYWEQFQQAPDFVVLFVPGEAFLGAALEQDKSLLAEALEARVILASPATLMALLRAVAFGWKQAALTANASQIRTLGEELHKRLSILTTHIQATGRQLGQSVESYNRLVGSLERHVIPSAKRLSELGISSERKLDTLDTLSVQPRPLVSDMESSSDLTHGSGDIL
ncbi:DNA recombination protein RmuC [Thiofilum flexile]|uniref:DNA recombination protein RmuC n=1 Tax=Thiofilum flexile TaxID=125627 RepID=UPI0003737E9B|nr:DNA recombination protein RmuC [Thiofilum flexile]